MHTHSDNQLRITLCTVSVVMAMLVIIMCNSLPLPDWMARFLVDKDPAKGVNFFAAQNVMWIAFFWGMAEIMVRGKGLSVQLGELQQHFLPENTNAILTKESMPEIHSDIIRKNGTGILANLVRLLASQFQISHSVSMCEAMLKSEIEIRNAQVEQGFNIVRYIVWLIPTLGFIGTVWGILQALETAKSLDPTSKEMLPSVIGAMSVAFWTTLLALILSCILMWFMHIVQGKEEKFLTQCHHYCLRNFINRLYVR